LKKIANYSSYKAAYPNALRNVDFRRSLLHQCSTVEMTLKHYPSFCIPHSLPVLLYGHWQERKSSRLHFYCSIAYCHPLWR